MRQGSRQTTSASDIKGHPNSIFNFLRLKRLMLHSILPSHWLIGHPTAVLIYAAVIVPSSLARGLDYNLHLGFAPILLGTDGSVHKCRPDRCGPEREQGHPPRSPDALTIQRRCVRRLASTRAQSRGKTVPVPKRSSSRLLAIGKRNNQPRRPKTPQTFKIAGLDDKQMASAPLRWCRLKSKISLC